MEFQVSSQGYRTKGLTADMGRVIRVSALGHSMKLTPILKGFFLLGAALSLLLALYLAAAGEGGTMIPMLVTTGLFWPAALVLVRQGGDFFYGWAALRKTWKLPDPAYAIRFGPEHIELKDFTGMRPMAYSRVDALYETKLAWYLGAGQNGYMVVRKNDFTQGDPEAFRAFIQEKAGREAKKVGWRLL